MSGNYSGLQARIKNQNKYAEYVPCAGHSLNLVGVQAAESTTEVVIYFDFVQKLYNFFSASTHRWAVLVLAIGPRGKVVKTLSNTRWSARADAFSALSCRYEQIKDALEKLSVDETQSADTRLVADSLQRKMDDLGIVLLTIFWIDILMRINKTSKFLQRERMDLSVAVKVMKSLASYLQVKRDAFEEYEERARATAPAADYKGSGCRVRKRSSRVTFFDEQSENSPDVVSHGSHKFKIETFIPAIDFLLSGLSGRSKAYQGLFDRFAFLEELPDLNMAEIRKKAECLASFYNNDLSKEELISESLHLKSYIVEEKETLKLKLSKIQSKEEKIWDDDSSNDDDEELNEVDQIKGREFRINIRHLYALLNEQSLFTLFPNIEIAMRIFLCMMVTNAGGERSFSKLKLIKNELRSTMKQSRLNCLSLMSIENDVLQGIEFADIINDFATRKCRKRLV